MSTELKLVERMVAANATPKISLQNVRKTFEKDRQRLEVISDLNFDVRDGDEDAAMRPNEVALELLFELLQRLVYEVLAATMTHGDVFLIRAKVANLFDGHELELVADPDRHVLARRDRRLRRTEPEQLRRA